MDTNCRQASHY